MTATAIVLALAIMASPIDVAVMAAESRTCPSNPTWRMPGHIDVFRADLHRVDRVPFRLYVKRVLASGAFPAWLPMASIEAGAVVVAQYARWEMAHPKRTGRRSGHACFHIRDGGGGQYYRDDVRIHSRIKAAVSAVWGVTVRKGSRFIRTGWTGDGGRCGQHVDGFHLLEDGASDCARRLGYGWRRIIRIYFSPIRIVYP